MIFCGSGATAAVSKLIGILELRLPEGPACRYRPLDQIPPAQRPVVFVGPYEHHSNELPWRETIADVVVIGTDADGHTDLADLSAQLARYAARPLRIGSFSAASNVTGILSDADAIAALLHSGGALSFWDYAAAAPYVPIRARESAPGAGDHKDAIFLSPHKFIGGPQTPGVLVVHRDLVRNQVPTAPGGGTVAFVDPIGHRYLDNPVAREEGGTPAIVESIRAGLVFALKQAVGTDAIQASEERLWKRAQFLGDVPAEQPGGPEYHLVPDPGERAKRGTRLPLLQQVRLPLPQVVVRGVPVDPKTRTSRLKPAPQPLGPQHPDLMPPRDRPPRRRLHGFHTPAAVPAWIGTAVPPRSASASRVRSPGGQPPSRRAAARRPGCAGGRAATSRHPPRCGARVVPASATRPGPPPPVCGRPAVPAWP